MAEYGPGEMRKSRQQTAAPSTTSFRRRWAGLSPYLSVSDTRSYDPGRHAGCRRARPHVVQKLRYRRALGVVANLDISEHLAPAHSG
jgi:hypothetical protein